MKAARAKFNFQAQSPKWVVLSFLMTFRSFSKKHVFRHLNRALISFHVASSESWTCRKGTSFTFTGRWTPTGLKESITGERVSSRQLTWRWDLSRRFSAVTCLIVLVSSPCPLQILPPTEKPTPIRSPTLQVLDYGEAVALYNFTGDLPVELSFRKVSDGMKKRSEKKRENQCLLH